MMGTATRRLAARLVGLSSAVLLVLVLAVSDATTPEPLHLQGLQDGGDYDSLIQPLVLALAGLPESDVPDLAPLGPSRECVSASVVAAPPRLIAGAAPSRAPPRA
jgi:hypothetical protein